MRREDLDRWPERTAPVGSVLWVTAVLFFGVGDVATTGIGLSVDGVAEGNPVVAPLVDSYGLAAVVGLKLLTFGVCYALWRLVSHPSRVGVPIGLSLLGGAATWWNLFVVATVLSA